MRSTSKIKKTNSKGIITNKVDTNEAYGATAFWARAIRNALRGAIIVFAILAGFMFLLFIKGLPPPPSPGTAADIIIRVAIWALTYGAVLGICCTRYEGKRQKILRPLIVVIGAIISLVVSALLIALDFALFPTIVTAILCGVMQTSEAKSKSGNSTAVKRQRK